MCCDQPKPPFANASNCMTPVNSHSSVELSLPIMGRILSDKEMKSPPVMFGSGVVMLWVWGYGTVQISLTFQFSCRYLYDGCYTPIDIYQLGGG